MVDCIPLCKFATKRTTLEKISYLQKHLEFRNRWCQIPYADHPHGCANYNNKPECPPKTPFFKDFCFMYSEFMLVWIEFDFQEYRHQMQVLHPQWTDRQLRNVLYWQGQVKKYLRTELQKLRTWQNFQPPIFLFKGWLGCGHYNEVCAMEATGINVFTTLKKNGIPYEIQPNKMVTLVCLLMK